MDLFKEKKKWLSILPWCRMTNAQDLKYFQSFQVKSVCCDVCLYT